MLIVECDYHPSVQQIAWADTGTGECGERRLAHCAEAEQFYRDLKQKGVSVRVGIEATGHSCWFERLLTEGESFLGSRIAPSLSACKSCRSCVMRVAIPVLSGQIGVPTHASSAVDAFPTNGDRVRSGVMSTTFSPEFPPEIYGAKACVEDANWFHAMALSQCCPSMVSVIFRLYFDAVCALSTKLLISRMPERKRAILAAKRPDCIQGGQCTIPSRFT